MSRKQPFKSAHHSSHHSTKFESSFAIDKTRWKRLWEKLGTNNAQSEDKSAENGTVPTQDPPKRPHPITLLLRLFAKLPRRKKPSFDPKQLQREILEEIGKELYQERQRQQLSLEMISTETRISIGLLTAIEKGKIENLPEAIYTRGLIKKFANYLGLNGKELAESYPTDTKLKPANSSRFRLGIPIFQFRPIHLYFLYIIIVIISVQSISNTLKRAALEGAVEDLPIPPPTLQTPSTPKDKKPISVKVNIKGDCQLKVIVDGKVAFDGVLSKATQKTWEANQNITLTASNAGQVFIAFNRQKAQRLGRLGETKTVTYKLKKAATQSPTN